MVIRLTRTAALAGAVLALLWCAGASLTSTASAGELLNTRSRTDLFYNYYVPPGPGGGVPAQLYIAPRPTPAYVGHTWVTYQPLMPHEFLYHHHRVYTRRDKYTGGMTRTCVCWW